jgi:hypothetical protein
VQGPTTNLFYSCDQETLTVEARMRKAGQLDKQMVLNLLCNYNVKVYNNKFVVNFLLAFPISKQLDNCV